jgi:hypothetical protein
MGRTLSPRAFGPISKAGCEERKRMHPLAVSQPSEATSRITQTYLGGLRVRFASAARPQPHAGRAGPHTSSGQQLRRQASGLQHH